jgi:putative endonuclease
MTTSSITFLNCNLPLKRYFYHVTGIPLSRAAILGRFGELKALRYLKKKGFYLWDKNWRLKKGEIDLVGRLDDTLIIVEVKTRWLIYTSKDESLALLNYNHRKHLKVRALAQHYIEATRVRQSREKIRSFRIDVIAIDVTTKWGFLPKVTSIIHREGVQSALNN